jgi:hypothetical protein
MRFCFRLLLGLGIVSKIESHFACALVDPNVYPVDGVSVSVFCPSNVDWFVEGYVVLLDLDVVGSADPADSVSVSSSRSWGWRWFFSSVDKRW